METDRCPQCTSTSRTERLRMLVDAHDPAVFGQSRLSPAQRAVLCRHPWHDETPHSCARDGHDIELIQVASAAGGPDIIGIRCAECPAKWRVVRE